MKFSRTLITLGCAAIACSAIVIAGPAMGEQQDAWQSPFSYDTADAVPALSASETPKINETEAAVLRRMISDVPRSVDADLGPTLDDMGDFGDGRVLLDSDAGRIGGIASNRGDVCLTNTYAEQTFTAVCIQKIRDKNGLALVSGWDGDSNTIFGIYAPDVESIVVQTSDGKSSSAAMDNNAFAWRSASRKSTPTAITVVRGGETIRQDVA